MKRIIIVLVISCVLLPNVFSQGKRERVYTPTETVTERIAGQPPEKLPPLDEWDGFQLAFFPGFPSGTINSNVYGLKLGLPMSSGEGRVWGTELSIFSSTTRHMKGFQTSVFANVCAILDGFQLGLINIATVSADGLQAGLVNFSDECGFQIGLVNVIAQGPVPFMLLINFQGEPKKKTYIQNEPPPEY